MDGATAASLAAEFDKREVELGQKRKAYDDAQLAQQTAYAAMEVAEKARDAARDAVAKKLGLK